MRIYRFSIVLVLGILLCTSCKEKKENKTVTTTVKEDSLSIYTFNKIDIHTHYRYDRNFLKPMLDKYNMKALIIDVVKHDSVGKTLRSWDAYSAFYNKYKGDIYIASGFSAWGIDESDYTEKVITSLKKEISEGARLVKVWKNFGMITQDKSGKHVQIDDARLQPIWDFLIEENIPVIAHIAEPIQAWIPIDTLNPHSGYFKSHPQYHAYLHPDKIPHYDTIIAARDRWLEKNPKLKVLGAHLGSTEHDVDLVAERLDKFPNFTVETGARFGDLVRQDSRKVAEFFNKYQDRILYGTDLGTRKPSFGATDERLKKNMNQMITMQWTYLATGDSIRYDSPNLPNVYDTKGLKLSREILQKVYYDNAAKLLNIEKK